MINPDDTPTTEESSLTDEALFKVGLLRICATLHAAYMGTDESDPTPRLKAYVRYLKKRYRAWTGYTSKSEPYDRIVNNMVGCSIYEGVQVLRARGVPDSELTV